MIRVLIVDDDSLIHVTLRSLLVWENLGYTVVQDCSNGNQALNYLKNHAIDLLITDMKMPGMGGLELMQRLRQQGRMPVTIALSGHDEFELVREAFRLGAYDYLLKSDINSVGLENLLRSVRKKLFRDIPAGGKEIVEPSETALPEGEYMAAVFQIQDFPVAARRFGDRLQEGLEKPMLELANQIHRLQGRAVFHADDPGQYTMYYTVRDRKRARNTVVSVVNQVRLAGFHESGGRRGGQRRIAAGAAGQHSPPLRDPGRAVHPSGEGKGQHPMGAGHSGRHL